MIITRFVAFISKLQFEQDGMPFEDYTIKKGEAINEA